MKDLKEKKKEVLGEIKEILHHSHEEEGLVGLSFKQNSAQVIGVDVEGLDTAIAFTFVKNEDLTMSTGHIYGTTVSFKDGQVQKKLKSAYLGIDFRSSNDIKVYYIDNDNLFELTTKTAFDEDTLYLVYWENEDYSQLFIGSFDFARKEEVRRIMTSHRKETREFLRQIAFELLFGNLQELKKEIFKGGKAEIEEETEGEIERELL